jgi:hypothetical protein
MALEHRFNLSLDQALTSLFNYVFATNAQIKGARFYRETVCDLSRGRQKGREKEKASDRLLAW